MKKLRGGKFVGHPDFTPENAKKGSVAAEGLCKWVCAIDSYDKVAKVVGPKKEKLAEKQAELKIVMTQLEEKQAALKKVQDEMATLNSNLAKAVEESKSLTQQAKECEVKLVRAQQLITSLGSEQERWTINSKELGIRYNNLLGDVCISSGVIAYLGAFTPNYRTRIIEDWESKCRGLGIICSKGFNLSTVLGEPVKIRAWNIQGLPADSFSVENALIVTMARRWPLLIDPQGQANKWIRNMEAENKLAVVKQTDPTFLRTLENSVQMGYPVLLENVPEDLAPALEPILLKQIFKLQGSWSIRLGDATVAYNENFKFYMTTTLRNPHYLPETAVKVSLINMMITQDGLQDQMLGIVVKQERPDLEIKRNELIVQGAKNQKQLGDIETKILEILSNSEGNILDDEKAILVLSSSKVSLLIFSATCISVIIIYLYRTLQYICIYMNKQVVANEIAEKQKIADITEAEINETRKGYKPVAFFASSIFFCVTDLANIDPMYQYSLNWFINIFLRSINDSEKNDDLTQRLKNLSDWFTYSLYNNVCRSLFEKDKLTFSFLLCLKIELTYGRLDMDEFKFLLTGGVSMGDPKEANPGAEWLSIKGWGEIVRLSDLPSMKNIHVDFGTQIKEWRAIYDDSNPDSAEFPSLWNKRTSNLFHRLLMLRCIRPDKVVPAVRSYVAATMGQKFVEPPPFDLALSYNDSSVNQPLIFVLSPGSDPTAALLAFSQIKGIQVNPISLGQGQGPKASAAIEQAIQNGQWVLLQNCHLAVSWMVSLEKHVEDIIPDKTHPTFRLWLTSYPSVNFPVPILQNGVKMTNEPPSGIRANLYKNFISNPIAEDGFYDKTAAVEGKGAAFKSLVLSLCYFHALVQERRGFGPLGWNIPYEFNASDLGISIRQLEMFILEQDKIPWDTLIYTAGHCNYGGRVTDDHDRKCLIAILTDLYCEDALKPGHKLSESGNYLMPSIGTDRNHYIEYIKALPQNQSPEIFGMHLNADISRNQQSTQLMFETCVVSGATAGAGGGGGKAKGGKTNDERMGEIAADILTKLPPAFQLDDIAEKFPVDYHECTNTVLVQECTRFNRLTAIVRDSMKKLQLAIKGEVVMSSDLESVGKAMLVGQVPAMWKKRSYPSLKPLGSYFNHLLDRLQMLQTWIDSSKPTVFWISGFFFTHSFTTAAKQNFARRYKIAIDLVGFDFEFLSTPRQDIKTPPKDGVYIYGLFLEAARWNPKERVLDEQFPKQLSEECPVLWLKAGVKEDFPYFPHYDCPLYREASRRGVLQTTGHSSNFVMDMKIPRRVDTPEKHWVKRGTCLLLELSD
jgi:dynein heavy chain